jgi:hypothetical protein
LSGIFFSGVRKIYPAGYARRHVARLLLIALFWFVASCTSTREPPPPPVNLSGFPPAYQTGFAAGCDSARSSRTRRDEARFAADRQYSSGWRDGFDICARKRHATPAGG